MRNWHMKIIIKLCGVATILALFALFTACGKETTDSIHESNSYSQAKLNDDSVVSIPNLLFTVQCNFPNSEYKNDFYYLCFFNDGSVYSMDYCIKSENGNNYEFMKKLFSADNSCWKYANNIELIGTISEQEKNELCNYISEVNLDSTFYDRESDDCIRIPDVEETVNYTFYGYIASENAISPFKIQSNGEQQGISYETNDSQALAALELIKNSKIFVEWVNVLDSN